MPAIYRTARETDRETRSVLRHGAWDVLFVGLALAHGALLLSVPSIPLIGIGLWWNANTISHNFIHRPFFRSRVLNAAFSCCLSLVLGLPQHLWRERHLAHHADKPWRWRWSNQLVVELALVAGLWIALMVLAPLFLITVYLPGLLLGLALCQLQGHFEHAQGTTSHYGRLYNVVFFNDGYHVEHHAHPGGYWRDLPKRIERSAKRSRWPAVLRWLDRCNLDGLERLVLRSKTLQRFVLKTHERAFRALLPALSGVGRVGIVGGGLFPRTALVLQRILPHARITVIDADADHLRTAKQLLNGSVYYVHEYFDGSPQRDYDLLVIPLAFDGNRAGIYRHPPASVVLVHDWFWRSRGRSKVVSWWLLKRMNLVRR
ncbi:MAG TPA: fatty acid desaturase [Verrucomicrobiae bacterium]|nr:fatty acid desaturase [Verrucomicrobiae bacterium]